MNRSFSLASRLPVLFGLVFSVVALVASADTASAQTYRSSRTWIDDDFGPSPTGSSDEDFRGNFDSGRRTYSRDDLRSPGGAGSRDPSRWMRDEFPEVPGFPSNRSYQRSLSPLWDDDYREPSRSQPRQSLPEYRRPSSRDWGYEELPAPRSVPRDRMPEDAIPSRSWDSWTPAPTKPVAHPQPTLAEKVAKRYQDPRVIRVLQQLTTQAGEAFYVETSQMIDSRHIAPTSYQQRVQSALEHLSIALDTPSFQQAAGLSANRQNIRTMQQELAAYGRQVQVQNLQQAIGVMRETGNMAANYLNVNPAVVSLAFVYGALDTLDQYSMFVAPEKTGSTSLGLKENMVGIGVEIESHPQGAKILKALGGGPAAEATLKRGDIITGVDSRSIAGLDLSQVADILGGAAGTSVKLALKRDAMIGDVVLVRRPFKVQSVSEARMETAGVGYIKLDQFAESSTRELDEALFKLHEQGMQSLILDLRGNPGGLLTTAIEISDRFLPSGTIVSTRGRTAADNSQETAQHANTWKVPLVVLIDHDSASASEIFAAAIKENQRGVIVGETSYGKGTVQTLFPMQSVSGALRLTTAKFYSPDGREMAGVGVTPDVKVSAAVRNSDTVDVVLQKALQAAKDPRLIDMAGQFARTGKADLRVIKVDA
jgi:carboxyl-terminal processing protease